MVRRRTVMRSRRAIMLLCCNGEGSCKGQQSCNDAEGHV